MALIILELFSQGPSTTVLDYFSLKICSDMFVFWRNFPSTRWNTILSSNLFLVFFLLVANSWKLNAEFMVGSEECMITLTFMYCCVLKMSIYFLFRQTNWLTHARFYISTSLIKAMFSNICIIVPFFKLLLLFSVWPCWFCLLVGGTNNDVLHG